VAKTHDGPYGKNASKVSFGQGKWATTITALSLPQQFIAMDEPTAGMDVPTRQGIWRRLLEQKQKGGTALVSSHYLEEFEGNVDAIFALKDGLIHKFDDVRDFIKVVAPKSKTMNEAFTTFYAIS
jgi:ABC-type multidrug transport system ATPase subunit